MRRPVKHLDGGGSHVQAGVCQERLYSGHDTEVALYERSRNLLKLPRRKADNGRWPIASPQVTSMTMQQWTKPSVLGSGYRTIWQRKPM